MEALVVQFKTIPGLKNKLKELGKQSYDCLSKTYSLEINKDAACPVNVLTAAYVLR